MNEAQKYLSLIAEHLVEHHAAVLVGAGFSCNAVKAQENVPDSPTWSELASIFSDKLATGASPSSQGLSQLSPLVLAERVEAVYGRPELNRILQTSIRDMDYYPSPLHHLLMRLPWSDIFTTNYDTLLERTADEIAEKSFTVVTSKEGLIGSSGKTRIVKLHGSFPAHHPFIITAEDYRTYPRKFAPFVNTVQQAILENTLCLIGFSGNDPNFESWIGWVRDNLGYEDAPNIYLLLHHQLSKAEHLLLSRKKIIPVDLSQLPGIKGDASPCEIYTNALNRLTQEVHTAQPQKWNYQKHLPALRNSNTTIEDALTALKAVHSSYPGWITVPCNELQLLRQSVLRPAKQFLAKCSASTSHSTDIDLQYLYEYDWLREKTLLPPFADELHHYHAILNRHSGSSSLYAISIKLSLLRDYRESGDWNSWDSLYGELKDSKAYFNSEQLHQLSWEESLSMLAQYRFREFKNCLDAWVVPTSTPVWCLRKAGLLAESGEPEQAQALLQQAIIDIRRRISRQRIIDLALLSQESALMTTSDFITQSLALDSGGAHLGSEDEPTAKKITDEQHSAVHSQYHVAWEDQNNYFVTRLEAFWTPFQTHRVESSFDFGQSTSTTHFGADNEIILSFSFLRFREETGVPFRIRQVHCNPKAALGAAQRLARYAPAWSVLTLTRSNQYKEVSKTITRSILSTWSVAEADKQVQFYCDAILRTDAELVPTEWLFDRCIAKYAAGVLPVILSELCSKCSRKMLGRILNLLDTLYSSKNCLCYSQLSVLSKRLISAYSSREQAKLIPQLLSFPVFSGDGDPRTRNCLHEPLEYLRTPDHLHTRKSARALPEIDALIVSCQKSTSSGGNLNRLLHCLCLGLLTKAQKVSLLGLLWKDGELKLPSDWYRTICLKLPNPPGTTWRKHFAKALSASAIDFNLGKGISLQPDVSIFYELDSFVRTYQNTFNLVQVSAILRNFATQTASFSHHFEADGDFMGINSSIRTQALHIQQSTWLLLSTNPKIHLTDTDFEYISTILNNADAVGALHFGLCDWWHQHVSSKYDPSTALLQGLRSTDECCLAFTYRAIALSIQEKTHLLNDNLITQGLSTIAQQIAWCVPRPLPFALQIITVTAEHHPELLSDEILKPVLTGLSQLLVQSTITIDDTVNTASKKGEVCMRAATLAKALAKVGWGQDRPAILEKWLAITKDPCEFSEIRTA